MTVESKTRAFCNAWQSISMIYKDYARRKGISYNSLYILNAIQQTENRRVKTIHLTEKGTQYADTLIPHIHHADRLAMEALSEEQQDELIWLMDLYVSTCRRKMLGE